MTSTIGSPPALVAQSMGKAFGVNDVLKGATLWCKAGTITVLIGRNGCGKSTLINVTLGIIKSDFGVVKMGDWATERPHTAHLADRGVFYSPQRGLLMPRFTLRTHLRMYEDRFEGDLMGAASRVGIAHVLDQRPDQISGGERKRTELALALIRKPTVLLADEPLAGLPPVDRAGLGGVLREIAAAGAAVLVTGHDAPELFGLADEITWMSAGTTHQIGSPRTALRHDQFVREYLGPGGRESVLAHLDAFL
jgi:ABC-type multidrug transport system ATPase subunit